MNLQSIILLLIIAVAVVFAVVKSRGNKCSCCEGCGGCDIKKDCESCKK